MSVGDVVKREIERTEEIATELNNVIFMGLYIGLNKILGEGARGLNAYVGREILRLMKETYGLNFDGCNDVQELLNRFTEVMINKLGFAREGQISHVDERTIVFRVVDPMDLPVIQRLKEENIKPVVYPLASAVISAIYEFTGKKAFIKDVSINDREVKVELKILD